MSRRSRRGGQGYRTQKIGYEHEAAGTIGQARSIRRKLVHSRRGGANLRSGRNAGVRPAAAEERTSHARAGRHGLNAEVVCEAPSADTSTDFDREVGEVRQDSLDRESVLGSH